MLPGLFLGLFPGLLFCLFSRITSPVLTKESIDPKELFLIDSLPKLSLVGRLINLCSRLDSLLLERLLELLLALLLERLIFLASSLVSSPQSPIPYSLFLITNPITPTTCIKFSCGNSS